MIEYNQFCPISKTAEVLGEKWTLLTAHHDRGMDGGSLPDRGAG
jgi:DNA-binding HxlR family transcriptional regulator